MVVPGLLKLLPRLNAIQTRIGAGDPLAAAQIEQDDFDLMIDVVHAGLSRAYPDFTRDDLLDLEAGFSDLAGALAIIAKQTGLFTPDRNRNAGGVGEGAPDFDRIVAQYCQMSGEAWTDALEDELTFARIFARHAYWRENPPPPALLVTIAVGMGVWRPQKQPEKDC